MGTQNSNPSVTVSEQTLPSRSCTGGVVLSALDGKIVLNQTLDERLNIAFQDLMPRNRHDAGLAFDSKKK